MLCQWKAHELVAATAYENKEPSPYSCKLNHGPTITKTRHQPTPRLIDNLLRSPAIVELGSLLAGCLAVMSLLVAHCQRH